jgi:hypothetical protein
MTVAQEFGAAAQNKADYFPAHVPIQLQTPPLGGAPPCMPTEISTVMILGVVHLAASTLALPLTFGTR